MPGRCTLTRATDVFTWAAAAHFLGDLDMSLWLKYTAAVNDLPAHVVDEAGCSYLQLRGQQLTVCFIVHKML